MVTAQRVMGPPVEAAGCDGVCPTVSVTAEGLYAMDGGRVMVLRLKVAVVDPLELVAVTVMVVRPNAEGMDAALMAQVVELMV